MWRGIRYIFEKSGFAIAAVLLSLLAVACGTGIEVTDHVTDKDVQRVLEQGEIKQQSISLTPYDDSLSVWRVGKRFWVADNRVRELMVHQSDYDLDTINLAGHVLTFQDAISALSYTGDENKVDIWFVDEADSRSYVYRFGMPKEAVGRGVSLPLLIDMDLVEHYAQQIQGKDYFIRTPIWYDRANEQMMNGRHFVKVHIDSVLPGNVVFPMRLLFTSDTGERAMVWMTENTSSMLGRDFDSMFSLNDPHLSYPTITDATWNLITRSQVVEGMTKEECRLSLGNPKSINERPDQSGMKEYWYYDGGSYLYFVDGLLNQFRR
ncbi:MAG: hypothetical protein IJK93_01135 [Muribaculaceae bacterium]|nr:hypothetical protein [Muribaculaceae bacterium]